LKAYAGGEKKGADNSKTGIKYKKYKKLSFNKIKIIEAVKAYQRESKQESIGVCVNL